MKTITDKSRKSLCGDAEFTFSVNVYVHSYLRLLANVLIN